MTTHIQALGLSGHYTTTCYTRIGSARWLATPCECSRSSVYMVWFGDAWHTSYLRATFDRWDFLRVLSCFCALVLLSFPNGQLCHSFKGRGLCVRVCLSTSACGCVGTYMHMRRHAVFEFGSGFSGTHFRTWASLTEAPKHGSSLFACARAAAAAAAVALGSGCFCCQSGSLLARFSTSFCLSVVLLRLGGPSARQLHSLYPWLCVCWKEVALFRVSLNGLAARERQANSIAESSAERDTRHFAASPRRLWGPGASFTLLASNCMRITQHSLPHVVCASFWSFAGRLGWPSKQPAFKRCVEKQRPYALVFAKRIDDVATYMPHACLTLPGMCAGVVGGQICVLSMCLCSSAQAATAAAAFWTDANLERCMWVGGWVTSPATDPDGRSTPCASTNQGLRKSYTRFACAVKTYIKHKLRVTLQGLCICVCVCVRFLCGYRLL